MLMLDEEGRISVGKHCYEVWEEERRCANCGSYRACMSGQRIEKKEYYKGYTYHIIMNPVEVRFPNGENVRCALECINITKGTPEGSGKERVKGKSIEELTDSLTGLYSWDGFYQKTRELLLADKEGEYVIVCYDINHFGVINDIYGHEYANAILQCREDGT